jgi:hypothetical protein
MNPERSPHDGRDTSSTVNWSAAEPDPSSTVDWSPAEPDDGRGTDLGEGEPLPPPPVVDRTSVLRVPKFSLLATILGVLLAWGTVALATALLTRLDVPLGFNLGIADGGPGDDGFWAGLWLLVVSAGGFLLGGYGAARHARNNGVRHAVIMWLIAMLATLADAVYESSRSGEEGVLRQIAGVPFWAETGMTENQDRIIVLVLFAAAALVGSVIGGAIGQGVNRAERTDDALVQRVG